MKTCKQCGLGKGRTCPQGTFGDNWNCTLINRIRALCSVAMRGEDPRLHYQYCDDQKYACINIDDVGIDLDSETDSYIGLALWVSWYKNRGRTEAMWVMSADTSPRVPTMGEIKLIVEFYENQKVI